MSSTHKGETPEGTVQTPEYLMAAVATGDETAFEELYDQFSARVFGLVLRILRDRTQSEEVTQEVFIEAWQHATRFDQGRGTVTTWLLTMAHRRAVDRVRASQSSRERDLRVGIKEFEASYDTVEEHAILHDESLRVAQALEQLTSGQREAIQMAYFDGYTHFEVATRLQIPVGTAKTRIRDGMIKLRDLMGVA